MSEYAPKRDRTANSLDQPGTLKRPARGHGVQKSRLRDRQADGRRHDGKLSGGKAVFLPLFAEVTELTENGYGFAGSPAGQRLFFHRNAGIRRDHFDALKRGDVIFALVGSDSRRPDRKEIVQWAAADGIAWDDGAPEDQRSWNEIRREWLDQHLQPLDMVLRPAWYLQKWGSAPAPADLRDDLLREVNRGGFTRG